MFTRRRDDNTTSVTTATTTNPSFFGRPVQNSIRPPSKTRQEHIDSYIKDGQLAPSTRKLSDDDSTFDTVFQSVTGDTLILRVHWPPTASGMIVRPPAMTLAGVEARHPWLDSRMRVTGYGPIQTSDAWLTANILLGTAVHTVIQHLQLNPPTIIRFVDSGLSAIQTKPTKVQSNSQPSASLINGNRSPPPPAYHDSLIKTSTVRQGNLSSPPYTNPGSNIDWPTIPPHFNELDSLSREQLEELMHNESKFRTFTNQLDVIKQYNQIQQDQLMKNVLIAKENLKYENEIKELYTTITKLHNELQTKVIAFQELEKKQDKLVQPPPKQIVIRELTKAKKEAYVQSEQIADQWLHASTNKNNNNNTTGGDDTMQQSVQTFIDDFMAVRKAQHIRAAKLEILQRNEK